MKLINLFKGPDSETKRKFADALLTVILLITVPIVYMGFLEHTIQEYNIFLSSTTDPELINRADICFKICNYILWVIIAMAVLFILATTYKSMMGPVGYVDNLIQAYVVLGFLCTLLMIISFSILKTTIMSNQSYIVGKSYNEVPKVIQRPDFLFSLYPLGYC